MNFGLKKDSQVESPSHYLQA
uniref:Uncharacterized protein n=1 Tax=Moniliophthora roreri TaxID=221103 RepID=A0A0W0FNP3_MONRR